MKTAKLYIAGALVLGAVMLAGCARKHHATYYQNIRYESPEISEFLGQTLDRDLRWADGNRDLRIAREDEARAWQLRTVPPPELTIGTRDLGEITDRLYGTTHGQ